MYGAFGYAQGYYGEGGLGGVVPIVPDVTADIAIIVAAYIDQVRVPAYVDVVEIPAVDVEVQQ